MTRAKSKNKGKDSTIVGFGSFYKQHPFVYSQRELLQEQRHCDFIHTVYCSKTNKVKHNQANNDLGLESDSCSCTSIHSGEYKACKGAETDLKAQYSNNKHLKHSH
eukprot:10647784-Ditylum_brightwellii.AAC.1